jgi:tetratricopeptide (TPR) repeat protein
VIPIDARLAGVENDRARFVQQLAATWYYYFDAAAETFEQDYLLTAKGLVPDGQARRTRNTISLPQAKERVKGLLRDYFTLAKGQSRESIAPEFLTCFEQLVELAPEFAKGYYNVGCMHALLGNHKQAVAFVTKAIALEPTYRKVARRDPDLESCARRPRARPFARGSRQVEHFHEPPGTFARNLLLPRPRTHADACCPTKKPVRLAGVHGSIRSCRI